MSMSLSASQLRIPDQMPTNTYREATRIQTSMLAALEKRCLVWIAARNPRVHQLGPPHSPGGAGDDRRGLCYWIGPSSPAAMSSIGIECSF